MKSLWMVAVLVLCTGLTSADGDDKKEEPKPSTVSSLFQIVLIAFDYCCVS